MEASMPNVKIQYVGVKKDGERAFKHDTDIEWFPGDVHEVDVKVAEQMLRHPDVFVQVDGEAVTAAGKPVLNAVAADQDEVDDEAIAKEAAAKKAKEDAQAKADAKAAAKAAQKQAAKDEAATKAAAKKTPAKKTAAKKAK
jgi:hypothetical protein